MSETLEESILNLLHHGLPDTQINCFHCGVCCRYGVSMGSEDAEAISRHIGVPFNSFLEGYSHDVWMTQGDYEWFANGCTDIDWIDELDNYRTRRNDGGCIFLKVFPKTHEVRCSIHTVRPPACRGYAPNLDREACQTGLRKMWGINVTPEFRLEGSVEKLKALHDFLKSII
jgi:Fe-S-cluster containining protein